MLEAGSVVTLVIVLAGSFTERGGPTREETREIFRRAREKTKGRRL